MQKWWNTKVRVAADDHETLPFFFLPSETDTRMKKKRMHGVSETTHTTIFLTAKSRGPKY